MEAKTRDPFNSCYPECESYRTGTLNTTVMMLTAPRVIVEHYQRSAGSLDRTEVLKETAVREH